MTLVDKIETQATNQYYVSNRAPLIPSSLIKLPVGSVKPDGFLKEFLLRQKKD
ncbi:hypothetical protein V8V91_15275 [Algoriphagus halophilus]|uniref:hypothetical protein n=1 Tax=Algoriphagus halophilus TaxID=226505 RepID=UPI00358E19BF